MADPPSRQPAPQRPDKLAKLLHAFSTGLRPVNDPRDARQYLQIILGQIDHALCIERVACNASTLNAFCQNIRCDTSIEFINGPFTNLLSYLSVPEVARLCNGECLKLVLRGLVDPPSLWNALCAAHEMHKLSAAANLNFAWLLRELLTWTVRSPANVHALATRATAARTFLDSDERQSRALGCRTEAILQAKSTGMTIRSGGPGGRHDNDAVDFRRISLFPTQDELTSKEAPYYSTAKTLSEMLSEARVAHHLDNQFRLLREDLLTSISKHSILHAIDT